MQYPQSSEVLCKLPSSTVNEHLHLPLPLPEHSQETTASKQMLSKASSSGPLAKYLVSKEAPTASMTLPLTQQHCHTASDERHHQHFNLA